MRKVLTGILLVGFLNGFGQGNIYWAESGGSPRIMRCDLNGGNAVVLVDTGLVSPRGLEVDTAGGKIYWTDIGTKKIQRADLDGSNVEDLVDSLDKPYDIALDLKAGKIYWTDYGTNKIQRANLDGTSEEDLISGWGKKLGIDVDTAAGKIYWMDNGSPSMRWANLDGTGMEILIPEITGYACETPNGIVLDLYNRKSYWTEDKKVWKVDTLGNPIGNLTTIAGTVTGVLKPTYIDIDIGAGKVYVTDSINNWIQAIDLIDWMNVENLSWTIGSTPRPQGVAVIGTVAVGENDKVEKEVRAVRVYPNPFNSVVKVQFSGLNESAEYSLVVTTIIGQTVSNTRIHQHILDLNLTGKQPGVYLYRVIENQTTISAGKLIKY